MTKLDDFLSGEPKKPIAIKNLEEATGSFACQTHGCEQIVYEAKVDRDKNKLFWYCDNGHESSVVI